MIWESVRVSPKHENQPYLTRFTILVLNVCTEREAQGNRLVSRFDSFLFLAARKLKITLFSDQGTRHTLVLISSSNENTLCAEAVTEKDSKCCFSFTSVALQPTPSKKFHLCRISQQNTILTFLRTIKCFHVRQVSMFS